MLWIEFSDGINDLEIFLKFIYLLFKKFEFKIRVDKVHFGGASMKVQTPLKFGLQKN